MAFCWRSGSIWCLLYAIQRSPRMSSVRVTMLGFWFDLRFPNRRRSRWTESSTVLESLKSPADESRRVSDSSIASGTGDPSDSSGISGTESTQSLVLSDT